MNELFNPTQQQEQQQQLQQQEYVTTTNEEENIAAQRAAIEAIHIGRETIQVAVQQGEQLRRAESIADETQYKLDKATRILRGMTWTGWIANKLTPIDSILSQKQQQRKHRDPPLVYDQETLPETTRPVTQALQNYHANIKVLESCETEEQKCTCQIICDTMHQAAYQELVKLQQSFGMESYALEFAIDFKTLRERQLACQQRSSFSSIGNKNNDNSLLATTDNNQRAELFGTSSSSSVSSESARQQPSSKDQKATVPGITGIEKQKQDDHLNVIAHSLGELNYIAQSLSEEMTKHHTVLDSLEDKGESILDTTRMVTRRAERLIQQKSWIPVQPTYCCTVSIRHITTGNYLSIDPNNKSYLTLLSQYDPVTCSFGIWKRNGTTVMGLQSTDTKKWMGQSMLLGQLSCSASSLGRREELEADIDGSATTPLIFDSLTSQKCTNQVRLLLSSAGWGHGAYLVVHSSTTSSSTTSYTLGIGGTRSMEERKNADRWCITNLNYVDE